jgi:hypothetical protein
LLIAVVDDYGPVTRSVTVVPAYRCLFGIAFSVTDTTIDSAGMEIAAKDEVMGREL